MKKSIKTALRITMLVIAAAIVGLNIYHLNASGLAGDTVPMPFGVGVTVVLSGSMEPDMSTGDLLIVTKRDSYGVGDDVVYQDGRITVVHRIIRVEDGNFITQGIANNSEDDPVEPQRIKGAVALVIPYAGTIVNIVKTPAATLLILVISFYLLERSFRRDKEKDDQQIDLIKAEIEALKKQNQEKK